MEIFVILVEPKYAGNVGAVARVMKNFGFSKLIIVSPYFSLDDENCRKYAMHAQDILDQAKIVRNFEDALKIVDYMVGTSSIESKNDKHHLRKAFTVRKFAEEIKKMEGRIGIAFGREDFGLLNKEIKKCDLLVKIPTSESYPSLNLSHAVCIVLYELFLNLNGYSPYEVVLANGKEKEKLYEFFNKLLDVIEYPDFKKERTKILFRRVIGRAMLSKWEYHALMGVFKKAIQKLRN